MIQYIKQFRCSIYEIETKNKSDKFEESGEKLQRDTQED